MTWLWILLGCVGVGALSGFSVEAFFGNHDPGAVFPWGFIAILLAISGGLIGLCVGLIVDLIRFMISCL